MQAYGTAKRRLFEMPDLRFAVINRDDAFGCELLAKGVAVPRLVTYGGTSGADVSWRAVERLEHGYRGFLVTPWGEARFRLPLIGDHNLANMGAAVAVLGGARARHRADPPTVSQSLRRYRGALQFVRAPERAIAVIDFAHTPDALAAALASLRPHCRGRLWCVVGCGGDRDRGKRPLMARAAVDGADRVVLTSDNPRSEEPERIH